MNEYNALNDRVNNNLLCMNDTNASNDRESNIKSKSLCMNDTNAFNDRESITKTDLICMNDYNAFNDRDHNASLNIETPILQHSTLDTCKHIIDDIFDRTMTIISKAELIKSRKANHKFLMALTQPKAEQVNPITPKRVISKRKRKDQSDRVMNPNSVKLTNFWSKAGFSSSKL